MCLLLGISRELRRTTRGVVVQRRFPIDPNAHVEIRLIHEQNGQDVTLRCNKGWANRLLTRMIGELSLAVKGYFTAFR
ncbi:MAG: hypothetical protein EBU34_08920 [Alphaproteobacteria bacterium]|nr:hypothetical protein [Alphaproteobacteria bacterium]